MFTIKNKYISNASRVNIVVTTCLLMVFFATVWQAQYAISPLEYGLMLSNAKDLSQGFKPYEQIFIQYGFLTTVIHAVAFRLLGENLLALMIVTALAYTIGLYFLYRLCQFTGMSDKAAIAVFVTYILFHPIAIYPWSNYLAFPFLMLGLRCTLNKKYETRLAVFAGICFGTAILAREGLAPAIGMYIIGSALLDFFRNQILIEVLTNLIKTVAGILMPIGLFFYYLYSNDLIIFWRQNAFDIPKIYAEVMFPHMRGFSLWRPWTILPMIMPLLEQIRTGFVIFEPRWILVAAVLLINLYVLVNSFFDAKKNKEGNDKIALMSLLLISSALHLPEIFRLATGSFLGIINLFLLCRNIKYKTIIFSLLMVLMSRNLFPVGSGTNFSSTNYFFPSASTTAKAQYVREPINFKGQMWPQETTDYYSQIDSDVQLIKQKCPQIKYYHNSTHDAFIAVLTPFKQYQLAPFWFFYEMEKLRPNLNLATQLTENDILLIRSSVVAGRKQDLTPPKGYHVLSEYKDPISAEMVVLQAPHTCVIN